MAEFFHCTLCKKPREGRFTRRRGATTSNWSKAGFSAPLYYCYNCLPLGEGTDEEPVAKKTTTSTKINPAVAATTPVKVNPEAVKTDGLKIVQSLTAEAEDYGTISSPQEYEEADIVLGRIVKAEKAWEERMQGIIRPMRAALEAIYALNREVTTPLGKLKASVKAAMLAFKQEENRKLLEAKQAREAEERRLLEEAEAKRVAAEQAKTPQMRGRLQAQAERAEEQAAAVTQQEEPLPTYATHASFRKVKKVRITDRAKFFRGVADGYIPEEAIEVKEKVLLDAYKSDPEGFAAFPGVEVYEDDQIVGR